MIEGTHLYEGRANSDAADLLLCSGGVEQRCNAHDGDPGAWGNPIYKVSVDHHNDIARHFSSWHNLGALLQCVCMERSQAHTSCQSGDYFDCLCT